ncbi:Uncharacterised protein [Metamycoplasma cloacale]|uniref:Uncharacterized protein n=1 Tax=Metamycoplasma cloacale TaxID=92401 RepID=A0A2Z4LLC4_9BACT|nr:hypothetical protein [Metamycoplasma cloacale]AWX42552.1 hypothetical protein DK849_00415 [Metamycoplasma cloacale]VEU79766.1 Uncharacterised protein [Metamycoplasma cloacale]
MKINNIKEMIYNTLSTIAGIVEFKQIDKEHDDPICVTESPKLPETLDICMGLVLLNNAFAKHIVEEIHQILIYTLEKENLNLGKLTIYIKGTK